MLRIDVCIITCRRPRMLDACLRGLAALEISPALDVQVVIVDNDPDGSEPPLRQAAVAAGLALPVRYVHEPRRGIPQARNMAVASLRHDTDLVAFIDDDEIPEPAWLQALVDMQSAQRADVVSGPVLSRFDTEPPRWVTDGTLYDHLRYPDGATIDTAATGNVLLTRRVFDGRVGLFDERLALAGGSDWHFFQRVHRAGLHMVWADDAVVHETVPASRLTVGWMLKRFYRNGITHGFCAVDLGHSPVRYLAVAGRGVAWILIGMVLTPIALVQPRWRLIKALRCITFGAGHIAAVVGRRYHEYQRVHGH